MPEKRSHGQTAVVDYDGTLCQNVDLSGGNPLPHGPPVEGAQEGTLLLRRLGWRIVVQSCRTNLELCRTQKNLMAEARGMVRNLEKHGIQFDAVSTAPGKAIGDVYIDDRGLGWAGWPVAMTRITALSLGIELPEEAAKCFCETYKTILKEGTRLAGESRSLAALALRKGSARGEVQNAVRGLQEAATAFRQHLAESPVATPEMVNQLDEDDALRIVSPVSTANTIRQFEAFIEQLSNIAQREVSTGNDRRLLESLTELYGLLSFRKS